MGSAETHHRKSVRLPGYDYRNPGAYFVTLVTAERRNLFGKVADGIMELSWRGRLVDECWRALPAHFHLLKLGAFVVMPNHVHGILILRESSSETGHPVGARHVVPLPRKPREFGKPVGGSLATVVQQFKSSVTRRIRSQGGANNPIWQRNYYEHIVRDQKDWERLHRYIESNPMLWEQDGDNRDYQGTRHLGAP